MKKMATLITFVSLLALCTGLSAAELGFNAIGGRLSFVDPEGAIGSTIGLGVQADLGTIVENVVLFPSIEYWSKGEGPLDFSQLALNADAHYYFPTSGEIQFFAGGGLAIIRSSSETSTIIGNVSGSSTDIGLDLLGGLDYPLTEQLMLNGELKFALTDLQSLKITAGITYLLGN